MAALNKHGYEVARVSRCVTVPDAEYEIVYSFRSDGWVLKNLKVTSPRQHNYGWKLLSRLSDSKRDTDARMKRLAQRWANAWQTDDTLLDSTI